MPETEDRPTGKPEEASKEPARDERTGRSAAAARINNQARWVDLQIQEAMQRGEFEDLPGYGKPIEDLGPEHDPDWWLKKLVEREQISVLPAALQLRKDDAELDEVLDRMPNETQVRHELEAFNERVRQARFQLDGGPPVITQMREVDAEVEAWAVRRAERVASRRSQDAAPTRRRRWWQRR